MGKPHRQGVQNKSAVLTATTTRTDAYGMTHLRLKGSGIPNLFSSSPKKRNGCPDMKSGQPFLFHVKFPFGKITEQSISVQ
jgi:hypothetical protein